MVEPQDNWAEGDHYEAFMGRWSRRLAPRYVSWLGAPDGAHWLDVGCGTGALTAAISANAHPASVVGCDPWQAFIDHARANVTDARASFVVAGTGRLPGREGGYERIASLLAFNFFPDRDAALHEMRALAAPRGTVSACVWDYPGDMAFLRHFWDAAIALDPGAHAMDERERFAFCQSTVLADLFRAAGLHDVRCEPIEMATEFAGFDDYWGPFLGGAGPAGAYTRSLDDPQRDALKTKLAREVPRGADGSIRLIARAWAVRGSVT